MTPKISTMKKMPSMSPIRSSTFRSLKEILPPHLTSTFKDCHLGPSWMISINPPSYCKPTNPTEWENWSSLLCFCWTENLIHPIILHMSVGGRIPSDSWWFLAASKTTHLFIAVFLVGAYQDANVLDSCPLLANFNLGAPWKPLIHRETARPSSPSLL